MTTAQEALDSFQPGAAWRPYEPRAADPWDDVKVAHLHRRAGFGANWQTITDGVRSDPGRIVEQLMTGAAGESERDFESQVARLRDGVIKGRDPLEVRALWLYRMLYSPWPLRERMTLFWHNHFATSNAKVRSLDLMQRQNETIRRHALGHFDALLAEMTVDPAMIVWLDAESNRKNAPNENYAREVMELFSLGVGNYTEKDIQEAARAFTGWKSKDGRAVFDPAEFDEGEKTVFGRTGRWSGGDVVRLCLSHEACARFIVRKLFRELISETAIPSDSLLEPLVSGFRSRNYDVAWLVETILRSNVFFSGAAIRQKVKSPCDFLVGSMLALEGRPSLTMLVEACDSLGQSLLFPPSVKGWDGGRAWINSSTLLKRQNLAFKITRGVGAGVRTDPARLLDEKRMEAIRAGKGAAERPDPAKLLRQHELLGPEKIAEFFLRLFHQHVDPRALRSIVAELEAERAAQSAVLYGDPAGESGLARTAAHLAMTLPEYQLA
ncbi:MAG: DUF1800 domain-containing protein [Planctomycetia bacterium]|nr:DUF1800 domain-containing protein [Planctomycetia bacterium]